MKILFLDVDGVLNSAETDMKAALTGADLMKPDPLLTIRLLGIVQDTECAIVLTSSWRLDKTLTWPFPVHDVTPRLQPEDGTHPHRSDEIAAWLGEHLDVGPYDFVILDDEADAGFGLGDRFVLVDPRVGLTAANAAQVVGLFT